MGEAQTQSQQEEPLVTVTPPIIAHKQKQQPIIIPTSMLDDHQQQPVIDRSTDLFSTLRLNSASNNRPPRTTKRRSPPSSSQPSAKKLFYDREDLTNHGFSAISLPVTLRRNAPVLRRCVSDHYKTPPPVRGSGLPPLPPRFTRCFSDVTPSPVKPSSRSLNFEEATPDSMRLKRMKERLREMKQWWDEVMKEEDKGDEEENSEVVENDKILSQHESGGDCEEAVSVEWAGKCVSLAFRCPCGKGYEVLISENSCYYKLL